MLLWLTGAASALVFIEPSPYEIASLLAISVFAIGGLTINAALLPLAFLLILINIGYTVSAAALLGEITVLIWIVTSWYLAVTALFFAAMLGANTERRVAALMRGCMIAGVIAAFAGVAAYFKLIPGSAEFLLYDRARGTFKDPNVFGAFLILPRCCAQASPAACSAHSPSIANQRLRIVLIAMAGVAAIAMLLAALLSIDAVANLFKERVSLDQQYDVGQMGRFGRHALGALLALDVPFGIGPMQFSKIFPEDPHNSYLNAFMSGGWLSGVTYPTLVLITLAFGLRYSFVATSWQPAMIAVYSAYTGMMIESLIIDSDHWRHVFLLLGVLWGLIAATRASVVRRRLAQASGRRLGPGLARPTTAS